MNTCETCNYSIEGDRGESLRCSSCIDYNQYELYEGDDLLNQGTLDALLGFDSEPVTVPAIYQIHLKAIVGEELVTEWWTSSNKVFDGETPMSYHEAGGDKEMRVAMYVIEMICESD